jgi:DNA-binding HxlR family transcriptional regulator
MCLRGRGPCISCIFCYILFRLYENGEIRFGQRKRQMPGIPTKMLTERLRTLEETEIISRH